MKSILNCMKYYSNHVEYCHIVGVGLTETCISCNVKNIHIKCKPECPCNYCYATFSIKENCIIVAYCVFNGECLKMLIICMQNKEEVIFFNFCTQW